MFELKVVSRFAAAHNLKMVAEKCENLHGHNFKVEVFVAGENLDEADVLVDFGQLKKYVREVVGFLDHKYLNELDAFAGRNASSENIAVFIAEELEKRLDYEGVRVSRVSIWESEDSCATFIP